ncbi:MAG: DUF2779 domain-containing protein [Ureaplasma sp.]|nr:DUF2779 domain-containing protein [Ureaplasma sp.]
MKKSKYITKYDYINYYVKQPNMWFFTNSEIDAAYQTQYKLASEKNKDNDLLDFFDDDEYENESYEATEYSIYCEYKENNELNKLSNNDPKLISGRLIDSFSKKAIIDWAKDTLLLDEFEVYDFDEHKFSMEENYKKTKNLLLEHKNIILFQPAFIDKKTYYKNNQCVLATKCDAIIKVGNLLYLIETKGTSSSKLHHILDLLFQKKVIEASLATNNIQFDINYNLCLVAYEKLTKDQGISFIVANTINLTKTAPAIPKKANDNISIKQLIKIGATHIRYWTQKQKEKIGIEIDDVLISNFEKYVEDKDIREREKFTKVNNLINEFDNSIIFLWEHKKNMEKLEIQQPYHFIPQYNDNGDYKKSDLWLELRNLYKLEGYEIFNYSGNIVNQKGSNLDKFYKLKSNNSNIEWREFISASNNEKQDFWLQHYFNARFEKIIDEKKYNALLQSLKEKRVYFDFETINPAFRLIDNTTPFTQVVTQCSIIIDNGGHDYNNVQCNNLMADPANYNISFLKEMIDALYCGSEYSYVVYNKTFETGRLKEINNYLNDPEYSKKINTIIDNIYDLAEFFSVSAEKYCILIRKLGGFHSIKKILALIEEYANDIFKLTNCVDYKKLAIQSGLMCQNKSMQRFFNNEEKQYVTDEEWEEVVTQSKKYCENDVRAMIAVYEFVKNISKYCN